MAASKKTIRVGYVPGTFSFILLYVLDFQEVNALTTSRTLPSTPPSRNSRPLLRRPGL
jgi:hypothetical protein